jgi:hypothetical protein
MADLLPADVDLQELDFEDESSNTFIANTEAGQIAGEDGGLEAMRQAVEIILTTKRYDYQIYSSNFGVELDDLVGEDPDYIKAVFPTRVRDAFSIDSRILSARNFTYSFSGDKATITFDVITVYGTVNTEVQV